MVAASYAKTKLNLEDQEKEEGLPSSSVCGRLNR